MASSFSDLGIELMATGENAGTWGDKTNTNLQIVEKSIAGYVEQAVTSGGTTALTITDGDATESTSVARHAVIKLTGTITGNSIVTVPDSIEKVYIVTNGTSGAYTVQFKTASGTGITFGVSEKTTRLVYSDGTNLVDAGFGGSLDIEGRELVLDADGDTTLTADTDDQIDIKIAGADDFQFTANTFTAQSGSTIAAQALTATTITASGIVKTDDTTEATSTTDGSLQTDGGLSVAKDAVIGDDLKLLSDSAVLSFGADSDTTLTHTDGTGLTLNSTNKFLFRDTALYINSSTDGQLDIVADTEIQIAATTIDINGAVAMDGAITGATNITLSGELDAATGDFSGDVDVDGTLEADAYTLGGSSFIKLAGTNFGNSLLLGHTTTGTLNNAQGNVGVGVTALDALTTADNNVAVGFGALSALASGNQNVAVGQDALTVNNSGSENTALGGRASRLLANGTGNTTVGYDAGTAMNSADADYNILIGHSAGDNITEGAGNVIIGSVDAAAVDGDRTLKIAGYDGSTTTTWISGDNSGNLTFAADVTLGDDLHLDSDAAVLKFGDDGEITLTHVADTGLALKHTATADDKPIKLTLQTGETDIAANDVIGAINFQAPDEGTGTDAILVAAGIEAVSEGDFSSSSNATKLSFKTGASETAAEKMSLSSAGVLTVSSTITANSQDVILGKSGGTNFSRSFLIGHATTGTLDAAEDNLGIGDAALNSVTSGDQNICLGSNAGTAITTGAANVYIGRNSGSGNATGSSNFGLGVDCLEDASFTGTGNVAIGRSAGSQMESANNNIVLGLSAGDNITTGDGNVIIGANVDADSATGSRQLKIAGYDGSTTTTWISGDSSGNLTFAGDVTVGDDLNLTTDSAVINFGADSDTTLTHTDGTGLTLNSTNKLCFNDATQFIQGASGTVLDIAATDEIELTATLIEVVGNATVSGTLGVTGIATFTDDIIIGDGKTIGSASDVDAITIAANGQLTLTQTLIGTALDISGDIDVDGTSNLDVVDIDGAVDMASTLGVTGVVTANAGVVVDNITIDGTEIDLSSGDLTVDVAGDIILDADGDDIIFNAGGTEIGRFSNSSTNFVIKSAVSDKDIIFKGNDSGSEVTVLTFDMSAAGEASFGNNIRVDDNLKIMVGTGNDLQISHDGSDSIINAAGTGGLLLQNNTNNQIVSIQSDDASGGLTDYVKADGGDGNVLLYFYGSEKLKTVTGGIEVTGAVTATGDVTAFSSSDKTLKENISNIEKAVDKVSKINGVYYNWTLDAQEKYAHFGKEKEVGVIAQNVEEVLPEIVQTREDGTKAVKYERLCALLIEAIKELKEEIEKLKKDS